MAISIRHSLAWLAFLIGTLVSVNASPPAGQSWNLVLDDEFTNDIILNRAIWGFGSTPWGSEAQGTCCLIRPQDTYLTSTGLVNVTEQGPFTGASGTVYDYADGWVWLKPSQWRTYGYLEIEAQYPNETGAWPAFWMLQSGWPPEIDIAEYRGTPLGYMTEAFYNDDSVWSTTTVPDTGNSFTGWHTYGLLWEPGVLKWYVDGVVHKSDTDPLVPNSPMYVILSGGADCSSANGTGFPNKFTIAYFRWYQAGITNSPVIVDVPTVEKENNANNLNLNSSWVGGIAPDAGHIALWDGRVTGANSISLGSDLSWAGICIANPGGDVTVSDGNTLTLGNSGINMSSATANLAINSGLTLGSGSQTWNIAAGQTLTLQSGTFTRSAGASLIMQGSGMVSNSMVGFSNDITGIIGPWACVSNVGVATDNSAAGYNFATVTNGYIAAYTNATSEPGTPSGFMGGIPAGGNGTVNYDVPSPTSGTTYAGAGINRNVNTIRYTGSAATQGGNSGVVTINGLMNAGNGLLTYQQQTTIGAEHELVITAGGADISFPATISGTSGGVTIVGPHTVTLSGINTYGGPTTVNSGTLALSGGGTLGTSGNALVVNGGTLDLGLASVTNGSVIIGNAIVQNGVLTATNYTATNISDALVSAWLDGTGNFTKNGPGTLTLSGTNSYSGATTVNDGTLLIDGSITSGPVTVANGTLGGVGTISGPVSVQSDGTIAPGSGFDSIGKLTMLDSLVLQPGSTVMVKIGDTGDGVANDSVTGLTSLSCGGTIVVTNIGEAALAAGDTFQILSAKTESGNFAAVELPQLGAGLLWTNRLALDGTLSILSTVTVSLVPTNLVWSISASNLSLSWPADHTGWRLLEQTNHLEEGISSNTNDWATVPNSQSTNQIILPIDSTKSAEFYRLVYP